MVQALIGQMLYAGPLVYDPAEAGHDVLHRNESRSNQAALASIGPSKPGPPAATYPRLSPRSVAAAQNA
jgi:hypothetical protein